LFEIHLFATVFKISLQNNSSIEQGGVNLHNRLQGQVLIIRLATAISAQILVTIQGIIVDLKKI
jgi:hypothetical protein